MESYIILFLTLLMVLVPSLKDSVAEAAAVPFVILYKMIAGIILLLTPVVRIVTYPFRVMNKNLFNFIVGYVSIVMAFLIANGVTN